MSAVSVVLLGLCAIITQSGVVVVARHFLDFHHERPLSAIGRIVMVTGIIFTVLSLLSAMFAPSALQGLFSLLFLAFLALFIYLDAASRCLPHCFTLAFRLIGAVFRFLLSPESRLPALLTVLTVFGVRALRTLAYRRDGRAGHVIFLLGGSLGHQWCRRFRRPIFAGKKIPLPHAMAEKHPLSFSTVCAVFVWRGSYHQISPIVPLINAKLLFMIS